MIKTLAHLNQLLYLINWQHFHAARNVLMQNWYFLHAQIKSMQGSNNLSQNFVANKAFCHLANK